MTAEFEPTTWHRSACTTCENNRGTQIRTDGRRTATIRGDKDHVATAGYTCDKGPRRATPPRRSSRSTTTCDPATRPCPTASASTRPPRTANTNAPASH
ncbi:hypothetical protein [Streptomyces sp. NPDC088719]|uniref:hypothetical protein n=1 Tax=Streptomyces sp. NPDC088719 TaxID=3365872 RepID=UPI003810FFD6